MADPKKKKAKRGNKSVNKSGEFNWTPQRRKAAQLLSEGRYNCKQVAKMINITPKTISVWRQSKVFLDEIDRLTLENELATKAGLARAAFRGMSIKERNIEDDRSSHLDYMKFMFDYVIGDDSDADDRLKKFAQVMKDCLN